MQSSWGRSREPRNPQDDAILNGFLIHQWRLPYQMEVLLNESVWDIFKNVWTQRNEILHNTDSYTSRAEATNATNRLLWYKRHKTELFSESNYYLICHPEIVIINWKLRKKKQQLEILDNSHREWKKECKLREEGQQQLNKLAGWEGFFTPLHEDNANKPNTDKET